MDQAIFERIRIIIGVTGKKELSTQTIELLQITRELSDADVDELKQFCREHEITIFDENDRAEPAQRHGEAEDELTPEEMELIARNCAKNLSAQYSIPEEEIRRKYQDRHLVLAGCYYGWATGEAMPLAEAARKAGIAPERASAVMQSMMRLGRRRGLLRRKPLSDFLN